MVGPSHQSEGERAEHPQAVRGQIQVGFAVACMARHRCCQALRQATYWNPHCSVVIGSRLNADGTSEALVNVSDLLAAIVAVSFGLWWIVLPATVIRFYTWFHRGAVRLPDTIGVRVAGALWLVLVLVVLWRR